MHTQVIQRGEGTVTLPVKVNTVWDKRWRTLEQYWDIILPSHFPLAH